MSDVIGYTRDNGEWRAIVLAPAQADDDMQHGHAVPIERLQGRDRIEAERFIEAMERRAA